MNLSFTWINLLILFGAINALVFSIVLLFQRQHPGSKFFSAFIFVFAYNGFETFNWSSGLDAHHITFDLLSFIVIYALGPSLYLYVSSLLEPSIRFSGKQLTAYYGFFIFQLVTRVFVVGYHLLHINGIVDFGVTPDFFVDLVWIYSEPVSVLVFIAFIFMVYRKIDASNKKATSHAIGKTQLKATLTWVNKLKFAVTGLAICWALTIIFPKVADFSGSDYYYPIELMLVVFVHWLVLDGYFTVKTITLKQKKESPLMATLDVEASKKRILAAMESDRIYLDPELNVAKAAAHLGMPAKTLSHIINQYYNCSFNDFINKYRVDEVSKRLAEADHLRFTISGLAFESGFNSQATFQRAFKSATGMSPSEFLNRRAPHQS